MITGRSDAGNTATFDVTTFLLLGYVFVVEV